MLLIEDKSLIIKNFKNIFFLILATNFILVICMLQGFFPDAITLPNTSLKLSSGQEILKDFFVPEGFVIPLINYFLGYFIQNKILGHFFITIFINILYQFLIFVILRKYNFSFKESIIFSVISSLFFLTNIGGIYFDHFILFNFLLCIYFYEYFKKSNFNLYIISILLSLLLFSKISLGLFSIFSFFIYIFLVRKEKIYNTFKLSLFFLLNIFLILVFIYSKDYNNFYLTVIKTGKIYSEYIRDINFINFIFLPFDLNFNYLFENLRLLADFNFDLDVAALMISSVSLVTYILYVFLLFLKKNNRLSLFIFYFFFQIIYSGISGQGIWMKYFIFGLVSAFIFSEIKVKKIGLLIIIYINLVFFYYVFSIRFLNVYELNLFNNFKLYDDGIYRLNLFQNDNINQINKIIDNDTYMIFNKELLYFNLLNNRASIDPLSTYDYMICNNYSKTCINLIRQNIKKFKPKFLMFLQDNELWNVDNLYYINFSDLIENIANVSKKKNFEDILILELVY